MNPLVIGIEILKTTIRATTLAETLIGFSKSQTTLPTLNKRYFKLSNFLFFFLNFSFNLKLLFFAPKYENSVYC